MIHVTKRKLAFVGAIILLTWFAVALKERLNDEEGCKCIAECQEINVIHQKPWMNQYCPEMCQVSGSCEDK